jgi:hypothetical protein
LKKQRVKNVNVKIPELPAVLKRSALTERPG